jgi:hypothetical protein
MQIQRDGRINDCFGSELERILKQKGIIQEAKKAETEPKTDITEKQLDDEGEHKNSKGKNKKQISETMDPQLKDERGGKDAKEQPTMEGQLEDNRKAATSPNAEKTGVTEKRLDEANKDVYPHRNEEAYKRTGNKRPINALKEEMGEMSDESKNERYEKASKKQPKETSAKQYSEYVKYRAGNKEAFASVQKIDASLAELLSKAEAEKRALTEDEKKTVQALKQEKVNLLKLGK